MYAVFTESKTIGNDGFVLKVLQVLKHIMEELGAFAYIVHCYIVIIIGQIFKNYLDALRLK